MSPELQEWVVGCIGLIAVFYLLRNLLRTWILYPLAQYLLKRGRVKWAMRLKPKSLGGGCPGCDSGCK